MRQQLIIIGILLVAAATIAIIKSVLYPHLTGYAAFTFFSFFLIFIFVAAILLINQYYIYRATSDKSTTPPKIVRWLNKRRSYRVAYPIKHRPKLIVEETDRLTRRHLAYPVIDLCQDGVCFIDDGSLGHVITLSGTIQLPENSKLLIKGDVIRRTGNHVCLQFNLPLPWAALLNEQRRLLKLK